MHDQTEGVARTLIDWVVAPATIVGSFLGYLPGVAAGFAIVWYSILIYDRWKYGKKT